MVIIDTSFQDAPAHMTTLSINHEATVDLDSTNSFEGITSLSVSLLNDMLKKSS